MSKKDIEIMVRYHHQAIADAKTDLYKELWEIAEMYAVRPLFEVMSQGLGKEFFTSEVRTELDHFFGTDSVKRWSQLAKYFRNELSSLESSEIEEIMLGYMVTCRNMSHNEAMIYLEKILVEYFSGFRNLTHEEAKILLKNTRK